MIVIHKGILIGQNIMYKYTCHLRSIMIKYYLHKDLFKIFTKYYSIIILDFYQTKWKLKKVKLTKFINILNNIFT